MIPPEQSPFHLHAEDYDRWFEKNPAIYEDQRAWLRTVLPVQGLGIEVGTGSGRFASRLGIRIGLDPSRPLLAMARDRGVETILGIGELLPLRTSTFDYLLMMTVICFMDDISAAFREACRVLKPGGLLVIGFIECDSEIARDEGGRFLQHARFRPAGEVLSALENTGFAAGSPERFRGISRIVAKKPPRD